MDSYIEGLLMQYPTEIKLKLNLRYTQTVCHDLRKFYTHSKLPFKLLFKRFLCNVIKNLTEKNTMFSFNCHDLYKGYD